MKKVLMLGAGNGQMPFINICKEKGYYVICASVEGDYPGFAVADKCYYVDTKEKEELLAIAQKENVDAVLSDQTDASMPAVAYITEKMGLKTIGYDMALVFSDKYVMRQNAERLGIAVPKFFKASTLQEALDGLKNIKMPAIMKPIDNSSSRGVRKFSDAETLAQYFDETKSFSPRGEVIIEEFIVGREYLADGLAIDGKFINTDVGIKEHFAKDGLYISKMCMFTSAISEELGAPERAVLEANRKMVEGMGLKHGITHGEYIVSEEDGRAYLVEIAARGGGIYLSSHLTPTACGLDTNRMLIEYLVEDKITDVHSLKPCNKTSAWMCFELHEGTIVEITNADKLSAIPGVFKVCLDDIKVGMEVSEMKNDAGKFGPILLAGNDRKECFDIIHTVKKTLNVVTVDKDGNRHNMSW